jgi:flagellar L-ring protein precursor FlgH
MTEVFKTTFIIASVLALTACTGTLDRLNNIGKDPAMSDIENPVEKPGYQPVRMPMPEKHVEVQQANSLWVSGRKSFFKDQRASNVGDVLTVLVSIKDDATLENKTEKLKGADETLGIPNFFGVESKLNKVLPQAVNPAALVGTNSATNDTGHGKLERTETVDLKLAAVVTQILPNGNMVIHGKQQVRVTNERRDLEVAGIIRPEDITTQNSIGYEKIAEARISYGGAGMLTDANKPRYGNEAMDILLPF